MEDIILKKDKYTVDEAAEILLLAPYVIREAVYGHELTAARVGKDILYLRRADILDWLRRREQEY